MLKLLTDKIEVGTLEHFISFAQEKKKNNKPTIKINISIYPSKSSLESLALEKLKSNVKG